MKQSKKSLGMKISAFVLSFAMVCTLLAGVNVVAFAAEDSDSVSVLRAYNPNNSEHLYTVDQAEYDANVARGYGAEGEAWKAPVVSTTEVWRAYNPNSGEHMLASQAEVEGLEAAGWQNEGLKMYSDDEMGVPIYRVFNPNATDAGSHHYCGQEEAAGLVALGWQWDNEGLPMLYGVDETPSEKEMTAVQTGAAEITVTTEVPFTGLEEFEVSHGLIEDSVEDIDFDDDMCTAVLTLDSEIKAAEYTVVCSDIEYEPATFEGEVAKVESLIFTGDELIANDNTMKAGMVGFVVLDQFGDPIQDDSIKDDSVKSGIGEATISLQPKYEDGKGAILITANSGAALTLGTSIPVSVVYADSTKVAQTTLTVSATSVVASMNVMDLTLNTSYSGYDDLEGKRVTTSRISLTDPTAIGGAEDVAYGIPFVAFDQYGNALNAAALTKMVEAGSLYVTPSWKHAGPNTGAALAVPAFMDHPDLDGVVVMPITGDGQNYGTAVINFLSTGGFSTTKNIEVAKDEVIDQLNVLVDDLQVGKPVPVLLSATDQYGEDVDLLTLYEKYNAKFDVDGTTLTITDFNGGKSEIKTSGAEFSKDENGIYLTAQAGQETIGTDVITVLTANNKVQIINKKVNKAATITDIKGLVPGTNTVIGGTGGSIDEIDLSKPSNFVFVDSYGEVVDQSKLANPITYTKTPGAGEYGYFIENTKTAATAITEVDNTGVITAKTASAVAVSETYKVSLYGDNAKGEHNQLLASKNFKVTRAGDAKSFAAGFVNPVLSTNEKSTIYAGEAFADTAKLVVYGVDNAGNKFPLNGGYDAALQATYVGGAVLDLNNGVLTVTDTNDDDDLDGTAYVDIYATVEDVKKVVATATIECSDDDPMPLMFMGVKFDMSEDPGNLAEASTEMVDLSSGLTFKTTDGYTAMHSDLDTLSGHAIPLDWDVVVLMSADGETAYAIAAVDQYGMLNADTANINGAPVNNTSLAAQGQYILAVASGTLTNKINITVK